MKIIKTVLEKKILLLLMILVLLAAGIFMQFGSKVRKEKTIISEAGIEKIINVSELSTFESVYNGVVEVKNEEKPEKTDFYISYESKVKSGIDFGKIEIKVDQENKKIEIKLPETELVDVDVDIASIDYMFINEKADTETVSAKAQKMAEEDARRECGQSEEIKKLAEQNSKNVIEALTGPLLDQLDADYELEIS